MVWFQDGTKVDGHEAMRDGDYIRITVNDKTHDARVLGRSWRHGFDGWTLFIYTSLGGTHVG